jgi:hypothetical protein
MAAEAGRTLEVERMQAQYKKDETAKRGGAPGNGQAATGKINLTAAEMDEVKAGWLPWAVRIIVFIATRGDHH